MIEFINDKKLIDDIDKYDVILVGTNIYYRMSNGFQAEIADKYPYVKEVNSTIKYGDPNNMGNILEASKEGKPTFVLMYINKGYNFRPDKNEDYLSYEALYRCLTKVNRDYQGKKIASTFIGASPFDGNGDKKKIMKLLREVITNCSITIYDYKQLRKADMTKEEYLKYLGMVNREDRQPFYDKIKKKKSKKKKLYLNDKDNCS